MISLPYGTFFDEIEISSVETVFHRNRRNLDLVNFLSTATDDLSFFFIFSDDKDGDREIEGRQWDRQSMTIERRQQIE
jgi:hypothetical protein